MGYTDEKRKGSVCFFGGLAGYRLISTYSNRLSRVCRLSFEMRFCGFLKKTCITSRGRSMVGWQSCWASKGLPTSTELTVWISQYLVDCANELQYCWGVVVVLLSPESVWFFVHQFPPLTGYEYLRALQSNSRGAHERESWGEKEKGLKFGTMGGQLKRRRVRGEKSKRELFWRTWVVFWTRQQASAEKWWIFTKEGSANNDVVVCHFK